MEQRISKPQIQHNHTTIKHLSHRRDFDVLFEEKQGDEINAQSTLHNTYKSINNPHIFSPDRSMLKQKLPSQIGRSNKMKTITDEYYNIAVFQKTNLFLRDIRNVIASQQQKLRSKRKLIIQQTMVRIQNRWEYLHQHLIEIVNQWCKTCQKYEINSFMQRSQPKINGALLQLLSQLGSKRQQIQIHESNIESLKRQEQILYGEELTSHIKQVKNYYKHVWNRDYEFQIESLEKESISKLNKPYIYEGMQTKSVNQLKEELKLQMNRFIQGYFNLNTTNQDRSQRSKQNNRNQQFSGTHTWPQKLAQRREEIYLERLQRDKQWIKLVQNLNR